MLNKKMNAFDVVNYIFLILLSFTFVYPILMTLAVSFSDPQQMVSHKIYFKPVGFTLDA
jgi:putative aldouronate transport system permease protein